MHDPRIGRFASIDPLAPSYPGNSQYAFAQNRVVDWLEIEGLEGSDTDLWINEKARTRLDNDPKFDEQVNNAVVIVGLLPTTVAIDAFITKGWLSRTALAYTTGEFWHSAEMQSYHRIRGQEELVKLYEAEGATATKELAIEGLFSVGVFSVRRLTMLTKLGKNDIFTESLGTRVLAQDYALETTKYKGWYDMNDFIANNEVYDLINDAGDIVDITTTAAQKLSASSYKRKLTRLSGLEGVEGSRNLQIYLPGGKYSADEITKFKNSLENYKKNLEIDNVNISVDEIQ